MLLTRTAAPVDFISTAELKAHLRIDHTYDDTILDIYRNVALQALDGRDGYLRRAVCSQTWTWELPEFPTGTELHFPLPPLQSVTSIEYYAADTNSLETFYYNADQSPAFTGKGDQWGAYTNAHVGYAKLTPSAAWPATYERDDAVKITFVAGYGNAAAVPNPIKWGALLLAGRLYANRGDGDESKDTSGDLSMIETERRLLAPFRVAEFCSSNEQYWKQARAHPHR